MSESRLRILMQSLASPFVISDAVRDTWSSTGIYLCAGQIAESVRLCAPRRQRRAEYRSPCSGCPAAPHLEAEAELSRSERDFVTWQWEEILDHVELVRAAAHERSVPRTRSDTSPGNDRCRTTS